MIILDRVSAPAPGGSPSRGERLAFWINAYNDLVTDGLRSLGIRESVWEVPDFFDRIQCRVEGIDFSANDIEHGVLRGNRPNPLSGVAAFPPEDARRVHVLAPPDPRVHFALNCGARSCPPLRRYDGERVEQQLDEATRLFVGQQVTVDGDGLAAPPIFQWFADDFGQWPGGLAGFLADHLEDGPVRRAVLARGLAHISWRPYDWRRPQAAPAPGAGGR